MLKLIWYNPVDFMSSKTTRITYKNTVWQKPISRSIWKEQEKIELIG
jgi:hypothetical protein